MSIVASVESWLKDFGSNAKKITDDVKSVVSTGQDVLNQINPPKVIKANDQVVGVVTDKNQGGVGVVQAPMDIGKIALYFFGGIVAIFALKKLLKA